MDDKVVATRDLHSRANAVIQSIVRRRLAGETLADEDVLAQFPELADLLVVELRKLRLIEKAGLRADAIPKLETPSACDGSTPRSQAPLNVRCPHCQESVEIPDDSPISRIVCSGCGNHFSLVSSADSGRSTILKSLTHFELIECVGMGGFGAVWRGYDHKLDRVVAVKVPRHGCLGDSEIEKFIREARTAAQLKHSNIVSVHEVGREGDTTFIVSDYVAGVSLDDWMADRKLTARQAAELVAIVADALHHAHERGVVHRDLKPANILIDNCGQPHITDFGLARREAGEVTMTMEGQVLGTPAYMSPEQARGEAHTADARTDVYSLGVILFQLLTGELPFRGSAPTLILQVINDEPPSLRSLSPVIPKDLDTVTLKCLEKEKASRYQSALEVASELRRFLAGEPIQARPVGRVERVWRWSRRNPRVALLAIVAFLFLCGGTIVSSIFGIEARRQARFAISNQQDAVIARDVALQEKHRATSSLYYAQIMAVPRQIELDRFDQARQILSEAPTENRSWEWGYFARLCNLDLGTFSDQDAILAVAFSPDGSTFATAGRSGHCKIYQWHSCKLLHVLVTQGADITSLAFSPNGRLLVTGHSYRNAGEAAATVWDVPSGRETFGLHGHDGGVKSVAFSRCGDFIATGGYDGTTRIWSAQNGEQLRVMEKRPQVVKSLAFSPSQDILATADWRGENVVRLWNVHTGEQVGQIPPSKSADDLSWRLPKPEIEALAFSPDGADLALGTNGGYIERWAVKDQRFLGQVKAGRFFAWALAFSPDGRFVASGSRDPEVCLFSIAEKRLVKKLRGHGLYVNAVSFSKDGRVLLTGSSDGTSKLWAVDDSREYLEFNRSRNFSYTRQVRFAPDGKTIATAANTDSFVRLYDVETGDEIMRLGPHEPEVRRLDYNRDGSKLVVAAGTVKLWDLRAGESRLLAYDAKEPVASAAISPDGNVVVAAIGKKIVRWDLSHDIRSTTIAEANGTWTHVRICPTGRFLACSTSFPGQLSIWKLDDLRAPFASKNFNQTIYDLAFSRDGNRISIASGHSPVVLDTSTGNEVLRLIGHSDSVASAAFSPDDTRIATSTISGAVNVWDSRNGRELLTLDSGQLPADAEWHSIDFSPGGECIAIGGLYKNAIGFWGAGGVILSAFPWKSNEKVASDLQKDLSFDPIKRTALARALSAKRPLPVSFTEPWTVRYYPFADDDQDGLPDDWTNLITGKPAHEARAETIDYSWSKNSPANGLPDDRFAVVATTIATLLSGEYQIETDSDDGIRVWVDDRLVIDNWTLHAETRDTIKLSLEPGPHSFRIEYFDASFDATLKLVLFRIE